MSRTRSFKSNVKNNIFPVVEVSFTLLKRSVWFILLVILPMVYQHQFQYGTLNNRFLAFCGMLLILLVICAVQNLLNKNNYKNKLSIKTGDLILTIYVAYNIFSYSTIAHYSGLSARLAEFICLSILYVLVRTGKAGLWRILCLLLMMSGTVQAVYGLLQLYGFYPSNHGLFNITGGFFNPGPYAGYLAAIWPVALYLYVHRKEVAPIKLPRYKAMLWISTRAQHLIERISHLFKQHSFKDRFNMDADTFLTRAETLLSKLVYAYVPLSCLLASILVIPATRSRAAWVSVILTSGLILLKKYQVKEKFHTIFNNHLKKTLALAFLALCLVGGVYGLFHFKKGSASGRLLIWKASGQMLADHPWAGVGFEKYAAHYMDYQAHYLEGKEESPEASLADEINYAYNTLLKRTTELGLFGFVMMAVLLFLVFNPLKNIQDPNSSMPGKASTMGIWGIFLFSMFSYPEHILSIKIIFTVLLGIRLSYSKPVNILTISRKSTKHHNSLKFLLLFIVAGVVVFTLPVYKKFRTALEQWEEAKMQYDMSLYESCIVEYEKAYPVLKNNGPFLLNYGKSLSMGKAHQKAITILKETEKHQKNTIVYTALGDSYKALGKTNEAEHAYIKAKQMIPGRFYPYYLLANLYQDTGQQEKAVQIARAVLEKEVKVPSTAIEEIKTEMKKIIQEGEVSNDTERDHK